MSYQFHGALRFGVFLFFFKLQISHDKNLCRAATKTNCLEVG